jgi:hypothetical protein
MLAYLTSERAGSLSLGAAGGDAAPAEGSNWVGAGVADFE